MHFNRINGSCLYQSLHTTNPPSPNMAFVKGGSFIMGNGAADKKWAHAETVADFSMSRY